MVARTETPQLYLLTVLNFFGVAIAPFHGYFRVCICIHEHVESTVAIQHGQEGYGCCYLAEYGLDLGLDFCLGLFFWRIIGTASSISIIGRIGLLVDVLWCKVFVVC